MESLSDKVSYLNGLVEGLGITADDVSNKLVIKVIDILGEMAKKIDRLNDKLNELNEYVEYIDDDLRCIEEENLYFDDEDDIDLDYDEIYGEDEDYEDDDEDDADFVEDADDGEANESDEGKLRNTIADGKNSFGMYEGCLCPECGGIFSVMINSDEGQMYICPHCGKRVGAVKMSCKNVPVADAWEGVKDE
ncbi:MAG: hypothetical protein Q4D04_07445 [Clostridia bacterium]|nr:hypothetical protein [Clostridia bacterium]